MRNLKRVLSLALALVMVLGMMVIGTSAATFTDAEEITYTEAVDVMAALGVINGFKAADGTYYFDADATLTREQGAAFICYMLMGKTAADKLVGSGNFSDVAADRWSAGAIDYCANLGLVKGNPDGTFNPTGPLTSIAFGRMLLGALGYDGDIEGYVGANWASCIAADMIDVGLVVKDVALDAQLTREQAAQMAFQALTKTMVKYTTKGTTITVNGMNIVSGASAAEPVVYAEAGGYDYTTGAEDAAQYATVQFCEKYFSNLSLSDDGDAGMDDFGRPGHTWTYGTAPTAKLFVTDAPVLTYTTAVTGGQIYTDLGKVSVTTMAKIVNGYNTEIDEAEYIFSGSEEPFGGNGTVIEIYKVDTGVYTAVGIQTFAGTITHHYDAVLNADGQVVTKEKVTVSVPVGESAITGDFETTDFSVLDALYNTVVLVTATTDGSTWTVQSVEAAEAKTLTATWRNAISFKADGTTYKYSENKNATISASNVTNKDEKVVYFDNYGYVILVTNPDTALPNYAVVLDYGTESVMASATTYYATLLYTDGTMATVKVSESASSLLNKVVEYAPGTGANTGKIVLSNAVAVTEGNTDIDNSKVDFALGETGYKANSKTVFLVQTTNPTTRKPVYTAYVGIANVPSLTVTDSESVTNGLAVVVAEGATYASVVFVKGAVLDTASSTSKDVVYVAASSKKTATDVNGDYYTYNVIVNGEITTFEASNAELTGFYGAITKDHMGLVSGGSSLSGAGIAAVSETGTNYAANGVIVLGSNHYSYNENTAVYVVKADDSIVASNIASVKYDANDTVVGYTTNNVLTMIVITVDPTEVEAE